MYNDEDNLKLIISLSRTMQSINKKQTKLINEKSLTLPQFGVLELLYHKGPLCISDIIEKTLSTSGNMTVVIENLRKDKCIEKIKDETDQRKYIISLTEKGKMIIEEVFPVHLENLDIIFGKLTKEEKKGLLSLLKKLR